MIYVKVGGTRYPAQIAGKIADRDWEGRETKSITLAMSHAAANELFVDGAAWSIIEQGEHPVYQKNESGELALDENGQPIQTSTEPYETEWDNSEFSLAGDITDHRDGTVTVKMGKLTDLEEAYEMMLGGV